MIKTYLQGSFKELHNVTWPTQKQAIRITLIVFAFIFIAAAILGFVDEILAYGYQKLLLLSASLRPAAGV